MANQVQTWISEGCFFPTGVMLLRELGGDTSDFEEKTAATASRADRERLRERLLARQYAGREYPTEAAVPLPPPDSKRAEPPAITDLRERAKGLHKRHAAVHAEMRLAKSRADRYALAREIMVEILPELDKTYDRIRKFKATGEIVTDAPPIERDGVVLMKKINSFRSQISMWEKELRSADITPKRQRTVEAALEIKKSGLAALLEMI